MGVTKELLAGSVNGSSIIVTGCTLAGAVLIHSAPVGSTDEVWVYGYNSYGSNVPVNLYWGGTNPGNTQTFGLAPAVGRQLLYDGRLIVNDGTNALSGCIYATTVQSGTNAVHIDGFVNSIV